MSKTTPTSSRVNLKTKAAFVEINKRAQSQPELVKKIGAIIVFDITKDGNVQQSWSKSKDITTKNTPLHFITD